MGRFFLTLVVGLALFLGVAWMFDLFVPGPEGKDKGPGTSSEDVELALGPVLYDAQPFKPVPPPPANYKPADPIVIPIHWVARDKPDVSAQVDGPILFIGQQIPDDVIALAGVAPFAADPFGYALVNQSGSDLIVIYRRLGENEKQMMEKHQMVALIDPAKALNEVVVKKSKEKVAETEYEGAMKTYEEAVVRYEAAKKLYERNPPLISREEFGEKKLARDKFYTEAQGKKAAIEAAQADVATAQIILKQHYVRNPIERGFIKTIYHNRGESVKNQEPILQMYSTEHLQAEGFVDKQYWARLRENMPLIIEPTVEDGPVLTLDAHKAEVHGVAVSKDSRLFVSVSEDRTAYVWEITGPKSVLPHSDPVRSVACTPPGSKQNWCITGCSDGSIYVWDLDNPETPPMKPIRDKHRDAVTALAFSPDGTYFASGSADNMILIWKTGEEKPLYAVEDHAPAGPVTSLTFTPQARLVSASRDNTLRVWELHEKGAKIMGEPIGGRSGNVNQLGVSNDGSYMLFDHGKTLQLLSVKDGKFIQNITAGTSFETLALFSPDGSLMLTAGGAEGRLQMWRTPTPYRRGSEVRQLVSEDKSVVTCAAFAPNVGTAANGTPALAVSGAKDGKVYLWEVPGKQAVQSHQIKNAKLTMLGYTVEGGTNRVRLGVQVPNPDGRLMDGGTATIVIEP